MRPLEVVAIVLDLLAAALLIWLAMRRAPLWISVVIILLVCSPWLVGWIAEIDEPDTRPGLLIFGGVLSVAFLVIAALAGRTLRHRLDKRQPH